MDTSIDFIRPEFLNILFFQQKNLIIFPHVDLKHLHGLEVFTVGHNLIDLESTALHNLKEILEFEVNNSYSQNPSLYLIYNLNRDHLEEIIGLEDIRCILNVNENINGLANLSNFVVFNKKTNQFINHDVSDSELEFERFLISSSENYEILQDKIQKIKIDASRIFTEINQVNNLDNLQEILSEHDKKFWSKILTFVSLYYDINLPNVSELTSTSISDVKKATQDFSNEYELILSRNKNIGKEFIQLLHEYRSKKVNSAHLELEELFNPQKLYNYLRNHHWQEGVPQDFLKNWVKMDFSKYGLTASDIIDFETILKKLKVSSQTIGDLMNSGAYIKNNDINRAKKPPVKIPSIQDFTRFKGWLIKKLDDIDKNLGI